MKNQVMFELENQELKNVMNNNLQEVYNQILNQWMVWVVEGEYIGGLDDFIMDGGLDCMSFNIDDVEVDGSDLDYNPIKLSGSVIGYRISDECDFDFQY